MKLLTFYFRLLVKTMLVALFSLVLISSTYGMKRPVILANAEDKARLESLMNQYRWAAGRFADIQQNMSSHLERHKSSPKDYLAEIVPDIPAGVVDHSIPLNIALTSSVLYFMTENKEYAQLAADILNVYVQHLGNVNHTVDISTSGPLRDFWDLFPMVGLTYDFIHPFLIQDGVTVQDKNSGTHIPFDYDLTQLMFVRIVERGLGLWIEGSNITIMQGAGILYCALSIENKQQRDNYIQAFMDGNKPMTGLYWMRQELIDNRGVWPESRHYSGHGDIIYILMDAIDRTYPELNIYKGIEVVLTGFSDRLLFVYPSHQERLCFGDTPRAGSGAPTVSASTINLIRHAGLEDNDKAKALLSHIAADREEFGVRSTVSHRSRGGHWVYNEFLSMQALEGYEPKRIENHAVVIPFAGLVIQNNLTGVDQREHGMMYYTGGAEYVHSHCSGLDFEIYGAGYVMGGVGGLWSPRDAAIFNDYYRNYAGHNTVVVNGTSRCSSQGFWGQQKLLYMDRTVMEALEPKPYTPSVSEYYTFSSQILNDDVNNATQQRIVSIVRTSGTTGYYFDMFRSRSEETDHYHDYIYHNMGEAFAMREARGSELPLIEAPDRYQSYPVTKYRVNAEEETTIHRYVSPDDNGGEYTQSLTLQFPGWHYFDDVMTSAPSANSIHGTFFMEALSRYNHVAMPGGTAREYSAATAPPIHDAAEPYAAISREGAEQRSKAQVLSIRQPGEAWDRPFIVIYEPSANEKPTVKSVENILFEGKVVGASVISEVDDMVITDRIIARDADGDTYSTIPISLVDSEKHQLAALEAARKSLVLLKNDNHTLPLSWNLYDRFRGFEEFM